MKRFQDRFLLLFFLLLLTAVPVLSEETLVLPEALEAIETNAFAGDTIVSKIVFGSKISTIAQGAFFGCDSVTSLVFKGGDLCFGRNTFPASATEAVFESGVTRIGADAFKGCTNLKRLVFRGTDTKIEPGAFSDCPLGTVVLAPFAGDASALIDGEQFLSPAYRGLLIGQQYAGATQWNPQTGREESVELHGCMEDAESLGRMLQEGKDESLGAIQVADYATVDILREQTADQILSAIPETLNASSEDDVSLFYYSGHGVTGGYLVGYDSSTKTLQPIAPRNLYAQLSRVPGKKIVIIDACYSGSLIGRGEGEDFVESFLSAFALGSRDGELAKDDFFVMVSASVQEGDMISVSINKDGIWMGLFTRFLTEAFGWNRVISAASGYGEWLDPSSLSMPADVDPADGCVSLKEAFLYADREVKAYIREWNSRQTVEKNKIHQVTKVWPYDEGDAWPEIADIILFGWAQN